MGAAQTTVKDQASSISPWNTQVVIDNRCTTPLRVFLARNPDKPTVKNAVHYTVPPQTAYSICSGWMKEPLASLILRTGVHEAKVFRMPHMTQLKVEPSASGLQVVPDDDVIVLEYPDAGAVPNHDTVAMVMREESFLDRRPAPKGSAAQKEKVIVDGPRKASRVQKVMQKVVAHSPWNTQIVIDNQCSTPVIVYLARDPEKPTVKNSIDHVCPAKSTYAIHSGWLTEPLATLIMRVGVHEAKIFRLPHMAELKVELAPSGLKVTSSDPLIIEDHPDPGAVPNNDTVPMVTRKESFGDRRPGSKEPRVVTHQGVVSDWHKPSLADDHDDDSVALPPQFAAAKAGEEEEVAAIASGAAGEPAPTVHGKAAEEEPSCDEF